MIKKVVLKERILVKVIPHEVGYDKYTVFAKYIAENGNAICAVNDEIVEPNAGNDMYRKAVSKGAECVEREVIDAGNDKILDIIASRVDKNVQYIDDYEQYSKARERNERLYTLASEFIHIATA